MNTIRKMRIFLIFTSLLGSGDLFAQRSSGQEDSTPADNTTVNQRDRNPNEPTADRQKNNPSDRNAQVTLKGPVRSVEEKRAIEAKATDIVGENDERTGYQTEARGSN